MGTRNKRHTCCECAFWNMAFDNSCSERVRLFGDFSNQAADKPACKHFEKEKI